MDLSVFGYSLCLFIYDVPLTSVNFYVNHVTSRLTVCSLYIYIYVCFLFFFILIFMHNCFISNSFFCKGSGFCFLSERTTDELEHPWCLSLKWGVLRRFDIQFLETFIDATQSTAAIVWCGLQSLNSYSSYRGFSLVK